MLGAALKMGAQAAGSSKSQANELHAAGIAMGLAFQITDDLLDIESSSSVLGKTIGKDAEQNKATYPAIVGVVAARKAAKDYCQQAISKFEVYPKKSQRLIQLTNFILDRKK